MPQVAAPGMARVLPRLGIRQLRFPQSRQMPPPERKEPPTFSHPETWVTPFAVRPNVGDGGESTSDAHKAKKS